MSFKYINPGIYPFDESGVVRSNSTSFSSLGYAFGATSTVEKLLPLVTLDQTYDEIYGTFDIYVPMISANNTFCGGIRFGFGSNNPYFRIVYCSSYNSKSKSRYTKFLFQFTGKEVSGFSQCGSLQYVYNTIHKIFFHIKLNAITQVLVDGVPIIDYPNNASDSSYIVKEMGYNTIRASMCTGFYISNLIFSDQPFTKNEKIIEVTMDSNTSISDKYIFEHQLMNMTSTKPWAFSTDSTNSFELMKMFTGLTSGQIITGIANVAYPAYSDGSPCDHITTFDPRESEEKITLSSSSLCGALSSWKVTQTGSKFMSEKYGWQVPFETPTIDIPTIEPIEPIIWTP